ncbi:hypothetical protein AgCh_031727 [Apium graveolens]
MKIEYSLSGFDKITRLPGQPKLGFQQYSGYVVIDKTNNTERAFFYYFVEAEKDPASKPLVLWFNGEANMLYWETPAGVGFSYSTNSSKTELNDVLTGVMDEVNKETSKFVDSYDVTLDVCISSVFAQSKVISPQVGTDKIDVCLEDETVNYLNRKDVQKALHARLIGVKKWEVCSNGDQDSILPLTGTRTLLHGLAKQLGLNTTVPYRVWFQGKQVGGWTQVYGNILSYATVRGAAHETPFSQPERSLLLFKSFLKSKPLPEKLT